MLLRVSIANLLSFNELTEFNMLTGDIRRHDHHVKSVGGAEVLKFGLLYGANAAGKSNLIKSIEILAEAFSEGTIDFDDELMHRFNEGSPKTATIEIEFLVKDKFYIYGLEFNSTIVTNEYLYYSGLGKKEDKLIFEKTVNELGGTKIELANKLDTGTNRKFILDLIKKKVLKKNELLVSRLMQFELPKVNNEIKPVHTWFDNLNIIYPKSKPINFLYHLSNSNQFLKFSNELLGTIDVGIDRLEIEDFTLKEYFGENDKQTIKEIQDEVDNQEHDGFIPYKLDVLILNENKKVTVRVLKIVHSGENGKEVKFSYSEESDGTKRLIEYLSVIYSLTLDKRDLVYIIDEMERSVHPYLLKQILKKLTSTQDISGQLIFTTHESNLMDQDLFRTDEIWLTEKNEKGETCFSPLSNFKLRTDLDLKKGYMTGRFGAIPILANFEDLNWISDAS
jgi:uncharacterized protein